MSEWICVDDIAVEIGGGYVDIDAESFMNAPSIEIIRCRECKYCSKDRIKWSVKDEDGNWIDTKCNLCRRTKLEVNLDDFCSYGKVSEIPTGSERRKNDRDMERNKRL